MKIIEIKDKKEIQEGLRRYNTSILGDQSFGEFSYSLVDKGTFKGGITGGYGWNYAGIEKLAYDDEATLKVLLNAVFADHNHLHGLDIGTSDEAIKAIFSRFGFHSNLKLKDMPIGQTFEYLINYDMAPYEVTEDWQVSTGADYKDHIDQGNIFIKGDSQEVIYGAYEGDELVGGLVGVYLNDYLYIDILWVDETKRKRGIGSKLMAHMEGLAQEKGIKNFWLGTGSFQARGLYEKLGYHVAARFEECPKGYENYTMVKNL